MTASIYSPKLTGDYHKDVDKLLRELERSRRAYQEMYESHVALLEDYNALTERNQVDLARLEQAMHDLAIANNSIGQIRRATISMKLDEMAKNPAFPGILDDTIYQMTDFGEPGPWPLMSAGERVDRVCGDNFGDAECPFCDFVVLKEGDKFRIGDRCQRCGAVITSVT